MFSKNCVRAAVAVIAAAFTLSLASHAEVSVGSKTARPLITQKIDENNLVTLKGNTRSEAKRPDFDRGAVDESMQLDDMMLQLKRAPEQQKALDTLVDRMHKPGDPLFHKWLTVKEFGDAFGLAPADIAQVTGWLESHGFKVNGVYPNGMVIDFSGTAGQVKEAFHTEIHNVVNRKGEAHIANMDDPKIPAALKDAVEGVISLTNFFPHKMISNPVVIIHHGDKSYKIPRDVFQAHKTELMAMIDAARSSGHHADDTFTCPASVCGSALTLYGEVPADFNKIYNVTPLWNASTPINGTGQTIVLIEDENMTAADFTSFRTAFLPTGFTGALTQVHPAGTATCGNPGGNSDESALDVEWAGAIAPNAAIELSSCTDTATTFGGLIAIQNMVNTANTPKVFSVSYGECEAETGTAGVAAFNAAYEQAAAQGQSVFVSSGDSDAAVCDGNGASFSTLGISVNGWGSSPYNVSVGGTDFGDYYAGTLSTYWNQTTSTSANFYESALSYINEIPWNDSCASQLIYTFAGAASGEAFCNSTAGANDLTTGGGSGGPSAVFSKPSFQAGFAGIQADGVRDMPDISLFASNGAWDQLLIFCYSAGAPCTYTSGTDTVDNGAGGTSFASPQMAAIQALINEQTGEAQGDPNYILYALAKTAYGASGNSSCNSTSGNAISSSCVYQDVTQGDNDAPCQTGTPNCYTSNSADTYGVLSLSSSSVQVAYPATTGWDFATGIGTPNAANLAAAWLAYANSAPTVSVATSPANILAGNVDTWTATVTGAGSYPTGSVAFSVSGTSGTIATITMPVVPASPTACTTTCSSTATYAYTVPGGTAGGVYTVTAAYTVTNEQYATASGTGTYNVVANSTTSALSASPNPIAYGAGATTFTDVISLSAAAGAPTGTVTLSSSVPQVGTITSFDASTCTYSASAKTDTCTYAWTPTYGGVQTITAAYVGNTSYAASNATTSLNVTQNSSSTTLSISPSTVTDVAIGTTYSTVTTYTGASAPTGTVTLATTPTGGPALSVNVSTCTTNTSAKTISCTIPDPNAWNEYNNAIYQVTATYSGDPGDAPSTSAAQQFVVAGTIVLTPTFTLGTASSTYATGGTTVATIGLAGTRAGGVPSGTVTITGTGTLGTLATITLPTATNSQCTLATRTWTCTATLTIPAGTAAGAYTLTATTSGNAEYLPESKTATYTINKATPTAAITSPSGAYLSTVTLSATNTGVTSGVAPTGAVTFKVNGVAATGTPTCSGSGLVETCTLSYALTAAQTAGTYTVTAVFATDTNYLASNTASGTLTVTTDGTSTTASASPASIVATGSSSVTATVSDTTTPAAVPTGTVNFNLGTSGGTLLGSCTLASGTCSATVAGSALAIGSNTIVATYAGVASEFTTSSGSTTVTVVNPGITFTSVSHNFGQVAVGTAATAYGLTITNTGTTAYPFSLVFTPAHGFTSANNCGTSIAAGAHCQLDFYFTPTATGAVSATWSLAPENGFSYTPSNGGTLQGSGTSNGGVSLTTNGHNFGTEPVGTTSAIYGTELSNSTTSAETITLGPVPSGPFTMLTNCGTTLAAGASCEIEFTFKPTTTGVVQVIVPLSGTPAAITSGGAALPNGGITLTGTGAGS